MRDSVVESLSQLIETTAPPFIDILFGIPHSVPIFILMPKHSSLSLPFTIMPVSVIMKLAEVRLIIVIELSGVQLLAINNGNRNEWSAITSN
jgi:hypothetical protein